MTRCFQRPGWTLALAWAVCSITPLAAHADWKAGTAKVAITPKQPMWMAGYGARNKPSEGVVHELWAKALVIQDPAGTRAALVTLDVCGIGRDLSVPIREALRSKMDLPRDRVVLACSHTHCGPVVGMNLISMYKIDDEQRGRIEQYAQFLKGAVVDAVVRAAEQLQPVEVAWGTGRADFAVNRRNNKEPDVPALRAKLALQGPVDHDVPVLRIRGADGNLRATVFGYACHCTVMDFYKFSGDYAGFAQLALEAAHPGAQAMFVAGCGADQNPLPRRKPELAEAYGHQLAQAVERVLREPLAPVSGPLHTAYQEIPLAFDELPTREQLENDAKSSDFYIASRARSLLQTFARDGKLSATYPYPVQVWKLGDLTWILLGGEVVVDYSLRLKGNLGGSRTWVSGYCNDVMAYIPSLRVLKEGGYEGASAMIYYGLPTKWSPDVEEDIVDTVAKLVGSSAKTP